MIEYWIGSDPEPKLIRQDVWVQEDVGANGRLLQSIKTGLRSPNYVGTSIFDKFYTIQDPVALILKELRRGAEEVLGQQVDSVLLGRPVKFNADPEQDEFAQATLRDAARAAGFKTPFSSLADLCRRTRLPRRLVENLILAGGMDGFGVERRGLLWELGRLRYEEEQLDLVFGDGGVDLPPLPAWEKLAHAYEMLGLSTELHPLELYRPWLARHGILNSTGLEAGESGQRVRVGGMVVVHQAPPAARGFHFVTLEDEEGLVNVIVRPQVYERYRRVLRGSLLLVVEGEVQREDGVVNLVAEHVVSMPSGGASSADG